METTMQEEQDAKIAKKPVVVVKRVKMRFKHKFFLIIISLLLMAFLRTGFMFVIIALLPSIIAYYLDATNHRYAFKTIFACNLSGMLPYIGKILQHGPSSALLQDIMGTGMNWFFIYGAALLGWLLVEICPMVAQVLIVGTNQSQIHHIERLQKKIENEWGPEVTQLAKKNNPNEDDDDTYS